MSDKKIIPLSIDVNHSSNSLLVYYELQISIPIEDSPPEIKKDVQCKEIPLQNYSEEDIPELRDALLKSCKLINPKQKELLGVLLKSLITGKKVQACGEISINRLDEYIQAMYEDMVIKVAATAAIMRLCADKDNLDIIASNDQLLASLARTLRDDGLRNIEIATNISYIFFLLSRYEIYSPALITHKVVSSLVKMIEQEDKRYKVLYKEVAEKKKTINPNDKAQKLKYMQEYENFKQVIKIQDKMLFASLMGILHVSEVTQIQTGDATYFIPLDKLVPLLISVLKRKPVNGQLVIAVVNFLHTLSIQEEAALLIKKYNITEYLVKLVQEDQDDEALEPVLRLLYNLSFSPDILHEMISLNIQEQLDKYVKQIKYKLIRYFKAECKGAKSEEECVAIICGNHNNHPDDDPKIERLAKSAALCARIVLQIGSTPQSLQILAKTDIAVDLTHIICLCPQPPLEIVLAMVNLSNEAKQAGYIMATGAHTSLSQQFDRIRDVRFAKIFSNLAMNTKNQMRDFSAEQAYVSKILEIASESIEDIEMVHECLIVVSGCSAKAVEVGKSKNLLKLAFGVLNSPEMKLSSSIQAIGAISTILSSRDHVKQLVDMEEFRYLPEILLRQLVEAIDYMNAIQEQGLFQIIFGDQDGSIDEYQLKFENMEYDLLINVLIAILRACQYGKLRKPFATRLEFQILLSKIIFTGLNRPENDQLCPRFMRQIQKIEEKIDVQNKKQKNTAALLAKMQKKIAEQSVGKVQPLIFKSDLKDVKLRVWHLIQAISDYIFDVIIENEPEVAENFRIARFRAYNMEFVEKVTGYDGDDEEIE
ncbi:Kinesin-associated protein [Spironucleus salmonicida]|uniref:Kinesin-associated protein n=1 Tax=Spironucleus salmonicida TaxID=348837 RepID=V6LQW3_9EUKA|nr:Kinesin-associated protein [Spironucleus salmonicida]|eukprot:EST46638.1 Kinesin-associated protein [Spironucleus salmonicida]